MEKSKETKVIHDRHDRGYKLLFSFYQIFQQLMEGYVAEPWTAQLDYTQSQRIDKTFIMEGFEKQESDILFKVPLLGESDKNIFLYVLIEHQSTVDFNMPFRILSYLVAVWREFYNNQDPNKVRQKEFRFPPVFPIVLYNGKEKWTASSSMREIVDQGIRFGEFTPNVRYHLIDIPRLNPEDLEKNGNSLAGAFLLEGDISAKDFKGVLKKALLYILKDATEEVAKAFKEWILYLFSKNITEAELDQIVQEIISKTKNNKEIGTMLEMMPEKLMNLGAQKENQKNIIQLLEIRIEPVSENTKKAIQKITDEKKLNQLFAIAAKAEKMGCVTHFFGFC